MCEEARKNDGFFWMGGSQVVDCRLVCHSAVSTPLKCTWCLRVHLTSTLNERTNGRTTRKDLFGGKRKKTRCDAKKKLLFLYSCIFFQKRGDSSVQKVKRFYFKVLTSVKRRSKKNRGGDWFFLLHDPVRCQEEEICLLNK